MTVMLRPVAALGYWLWPAAHVHEDRSVLTDSSASSSAACPFLNMPSFEVLEC